jgi:FkbM family methyltransferase
MERRHVDEVARMRSLGFRTRLGFLLLYATRAWRRQPVGVPLGGGRVFFDPHSLAADWETWRQMFFPRYDVYGGNYRGAVVVDIGAHKGYYGAYALLHGAACVLSYEPQSTNFELLRRAAASYHNAAWEVEHAAVGARAREAQLQVAHESWSHTLFAHADATWIGATERVPVVPVGSILERAETLGGSRLLVKLDAEGSECEIVLESDEQAWRRVDCVYLEHHRFAPCSLDAILQRLAATGLTEVEERHEVVAVARRA